MILKHLRRHPGRLCLRCLADRAALSLDVVSAVVVDLAGAVQTGAAPVCRLCGRHEVVVRASPQVLNVSTLR